MNKKLVEWKNILHSDRENLEYLYAMRDRYISEEEENSLSYRNIMNKIYFLEEAKKKEQEMEEAKKTVDEQARLFLQKEQMDKEFLSVLLLNIINDHDIYYVAKIHQFVMFDSDGSYIMITAPALKTLFPVLSEREKTYQLFLETLEIENRLKYNLTHSFNVVPENTLNLLRAEFLEPDKEYLTGKYGGEQVNPIFKILLTSLGGGKQDNIDHIERVIAWKYLYPHDFLLPALILFGQGGVGKGLFAHTILKTIFGSRLVSVVPPDKVLGDKNGAIVGKAIIVIDESLDTKVDMQAFKRVVGSPTILVDEKFIPVFESENTALYITTANSAQGSVLLSKDGSDRRWSILYCEQRLEKFIREQLGVEYVNAEKEIISGEDMDRVLAPLSEREEVAKWLGYIIYKWREFGRPAALHGGDYSQLVEVQKTEFDTFMDEYFLVPIPDVYGNDDLMGKNEEEDWMIKFKDLYDDYKQVSMEDNPSGGVLRKGNFKTRVIDWLRNNRQDLVFVPKIEIKIGGKRTSLSAVMRKDQLGHVITVDEERWHRRREETRARLTSREDME